MKPSEPRYVCKNCKELADISWDFKDAEQLLTCWLCKKVRFCRLSDLRKVVCTCTCACRNCKAARKKRMVH